jgi:hypothetical protein
MRRSQQDFCGVTGGIACHLNLLLGRDLWVKIMGGFALISHATIYETSSRLGALESDDHVLDEILVGFLLRVSIALYELPPC